MSFLWGSSAPEPKKPVATPQEKARNFLVATYTKHRPDKVKDIDTILTVYKGREDELITSVTEKYLTPQALRVSDIRRQLIEHYQTHNPIKVPRVDEMLERFKGKEEDLLAEVMKKHTDSSEILSAVETAPMHDEPNTTLPVHLQDKRLFYSGYLWQQVNGWLTTRQKRWCMLIGQHFYVGEEPIDASFEALPLKDAEVADHADIDEAFAFCLKHPTAGSLVFYTDNEVDKLVWCVKLEVATLQATPERAADEQSRALYQKVFSEYPARLCVPYHKEAATVVPEKLTQPVLTGYVVCSTGDSWLGENWARRYVTLHDCFLTLRDDKASAAGVRIFPLRDGELEELPADGNSSDATFAFYSDFVPQLAIRPDTPDQYKQWFTAFSEAFQQSNPERTAAEASEKKEPEKKQQTLI
ncbi:hypothetical protein DIPPA_03131 [Diplonema papillatum]|nr:hypothetical protein DIPPA_03131 [Diplonema papillatum]